MTGSFASLTGPGTSWKDCRNRFGTPLTGPFSICSKNLSRRSLTHFPKQTRCQVLTVSTFRSDGLTIWYTVTESPGGQVVIVVQYIKADT